MVYLKKKKMFFRNVRRITSYSMYSCFATTDFCILSFDDDTLRRRLLNNPPPRVLYVPRHGLDDSRQQTASCQANLSHDGKPRWRGAFGDRKDGREKRGGEGGEDAYSSIVKEPGGGLDREMV